MITVVQRVKRASVSVQGKVVGQIGKGALVLLGVAKTDTPKDIEFLANKIVNLRMFEDADAKMNLSALDVKGEFLVVSQFTLLGDCLQGRRPSFSDAADPIKGEEFYQVFVERLKQYNVNVQTGQFRAMMDVSLINDGPVTFIIESSQQA
jgi:D-aminoacyl-tRNA deacylase